MSIDTTNLRKLAQDAEGYGSCKYAWPHDEHDGVAVVGQIHDGEKYPVAEIDTGQYFANEEAIKLAEFYAAASPATVLQLLDEVDRMRSDIEGAAECVANQSQKIARLLEIEKAARNLQKAKGRHNTEIAMNRLQATLAASE